jgi:hypothetical protein
MHKQGALLLLGLAIIVGGWWSIAAGSRDRPREGVLDVWVARGTDSDSIAAMLERYGQESGSPVAVKVGVKAEQLAEAMAGSAPPDLVILNGPEPVPSYGVQGMVEPLDRWVEATGSDRDVAPARPAECTAADGAALCLPCEVVEGAVALMPRGANDKPAAASLLAWMISLEI